MSDSRTLEEWDALFRTPFPKQMKLIFSDGTVIENDRIVQESLLLEEALCSEQNLQYGRCEAANFCIRIVVEPVPPEQYIIDSDGNTVIASDGSAIMDASDFSLTIDKSFEGLYVRALMVMDDDREGLFVDSEGNYIVTDEGDRYKYRDIPSANFGYFRVISDTPTSDRVYRDLICYDYMYDILNANVADWYNNLEFPITIKDMRDSFFEYLNIRQEETTLINDDFEVNGEFKVDYDLSGKSIIEAICELNGAFGHINREGVFEYITLPTQDSLEYPYYIDGSSRYEDYITSPITGISLSTDTGDDSITVGQVGSAYNTYYMQANPLTYQKDEDEDLQIALENLLGMISQFTYRPYTVATYGNPMLPLGTNIQFQTRYKPISSFVMSRSLTGIQQLKDSFSATGLKNYPPDTNSTSNTVSRAQNMAVQQNNAIVLKVDNNGNMVAVKLGESASKGSFFDLNADNIKFVANSTLNMKAAQLNIESDKVSITPNGKLTAVDATFEGSIDATTMLFWDTLNMYSGYSQFEFPLITYRVDTEESRVIFYRPTTWGTTVESISLWSLNSSDGYDGWLHGDWEVLGNFEVSGTKNRVVDTKDYGKKLLYSYETTSPMFGDLGDGEIAEDGKCYISLDPVFAQTITTSNYQVFLQKCGEGDCYVAERTPNYFVVKGTPNLSFSWELKAKQSDFDQRRLEPQGLYKSQPTPDYGEIGLQHINKINSEREVV